MPRHTRTAERPEWFEERGAIFQQAMEQFVSELKHQPGVVRILLIGSVARGERRPHDLDLAVVVSDPEISVPHVSRARRRLSRATHLADVFVFDEAEQYLGRICQRKPRNCPSPSIECIAGCGEIKCLKIVPGFRAFSDILVGGRLLWDTDWDPRDGA